MRGSLHSRVRGTPHTRRTNTLIIPLVDMDMDIQTLTLLPLPRQHLLPLLSPKKQPHPAPATHGKPYPTPAARSPPPPHPLPNTLSSLSVPAVQHTPSSPPQQQQPQQLFRLHRLIAAPAQKSNPLLLPCSHHPHSTARFRCAAMRVRRLFFRR